LFRKDRLEKASETVSYPMACNCRGNDFLH